MDRCTTIGSAAPDAKDGRPTEFTCPTLPDATTQNINRLVATAVEVDIGKAPEFKFGHHHSYDVLSPRYTSGTPRPPTVPVLAGPHSPGAHVRPRIPTFPTGPSPYGATGGVPTPANPYDATGGSTAGLAPPPPPPPPPAVNPYAAVFLETETELETNEGVFLETDDAADGETPGPFAGRPPWPKVGLLYRIPYCLHDTVNLQQMILIFSGMREISRGNLVMRQLISNCNDPAPHKIRFAPLDPAIEQGMRDRNEITPSQFLMGASSVGVVRPTHPFQDIVLRMYGPPEQQASVGTIVHETLHAMGFLHTNQRADRDTYLQVTVPTDPTVRGSSMWMNNCEKHAVGSTTLFDHGTYDFSSIMHYAPSLCGIGAAARPSTTPAAGAWPPGQASQLSVQDLVGINAVYN